MTATGTAVARQLLDFLHRRSDEMVELLRALVRAESPSDNPASQREVQAILDAALEAAGLHVRRIAGQKTGGHLLAVPRVRQRGKPLQMLLGHCDTVWPIGTLREMPVHLHEGRLHGPGVYDMKAGLVQTVFALRAVRALGVAPRVDPLVLVNSDEEIGSPESSVTIRRLARIADRVFVMEPSLGPSGRLKTARKGGGHFTVRVAGRAAHAGLAPEEGASAILELSHVIQRLFALNDPQRGITVNVGTIDGGLRPNVVAPLSRAEVDVRVVTREDARRVEQAIHAIQAITPGTSLQIEGSVSRPPMERTPGNLRLWEAARESAAELGLEIEEGMAGGGSDGNWTSQFTPTLDGMGAVGDGAHAVTEFVYVDKLAERAALLARLLLLPPLTVA
jgi:glutamate carboxypeptidase